MLRKFLFSILILFSIVLISCSPKHSEIIVAEYGNYDIKMDEFEKAYSKNVGSEEQAKKDSVENYKKFLDLYINYKMKLRDADIRNFYKDNALIKELSEYEKSIGSSYLLEKELYEKGISDLYNKRSEELRVSHLLIRTDTLSQQEAEKKAYEIIDRVNKGESFEELVKLYSGDSFSKMKGGDIYYITAGTILPQFEDAAYNTKIGEINQTPVKTQYGYHIVKVTDRRKRIPQINASHILIKTIDDKNLPVDKEPKLKLAKEILERLKKGEDFSKLALQFSDDTGTKDKNGALGYFARRQMVQPFDEAAFNLEVGQISDIVETQFGYHIIKLLDKLDYPSLEQERKSLRDLYEKTRKNLDYEKLIEKYSNDVKFVMHDDVLKEVLSLSDSSVVGESYWESNFRNKVLNKSLFEIGNLNYTMDSVMNYLLNHQKHIGSVVDDKLFNSFFKDYKNEMILQAKAQELSKTDKNFAQLMDEYKNGIFIFKLQEDEVWNKMELDSAKIYQLYEKTKDKYKIENKVAYLEIFTKSDSLINVCFTLLQEGNNFDTLYSKYSERKNSKTKNLSEFKDNDLAAKTAFSLNAKDDYSEIFKNGNGWSIVKLLDKENARLKTFEEARAEVTSAYQDLESKELENSYINRLKNTYKPKLYYEKLAEAFNNK